MTMPTHRPGSSPLNPLLRLIWALFIVNLAEDFCFVLFNLDRRDFIPDFFILLALYYARAVYNFVCRNFFKITLAVIVLSIIGRGIIAFLAFVLLLIFSEPYFNYTTPYFEFFKLVVSGKTQACINSAEDTGNSKFGFCKKYIAEHGIWYTAIPYEYAIVYDSGDQLSIRVDKRPLQWQNALKAIYLAQEGLQEPLSYGPTKPTEIFGEIIPLGWHFYYVSF